jgi:hypothetical protein
MDKILSTQTGKIRAFKSNLVDSIEQSKERGCNLRNIQETSSQLIEAFDALLSMYDKVEKQGDEAFRGMLPQFETAYMEWKELNSLLRDTLRSAYLGHIPSSNLALDEIQSSLEKRVGRRITARYAELQVRWAKHLESCPWDAFLSGVARHVEMAEFEERLESLRRGDDFDCEEAAQKLTSDLRHLLKIHLETSDDAKEAAEIGEALWKWPEVVIVNDFWNSGPGEKLLDTLVSKASKSASGFASARRFFDEHTLKTGAVERILATVKQSAPGEKARLLRCLVFHPDQSIRRYAVTNIDTPSFWRSLVPATMPCASILSMLERIIGSKSYDDNARKIFFDTVYKRLFSLTSRSDVLYARGIVRIFCKLDFFLEDAYFEKLMKLVDYLEFKERYYKLDKTFLEEHLAKLRETKQKKGNVGSEEPDFGRIPPVILRKLARDGHYWFELASHPVYKVAVETVPYINTQDRALRIATRRGVNQEVLRAVGKKKSLFATRTNKLALLSNPHTPPTVSMEYVPDLAKSDIEILLRTSTIHPELRNFLRKKTHS